MTNTQKLLNEKLKDQGCSLRQLVKYQRRKGHTWDQVATRIDETTGVRVSRESLRKWFG